MTKLETLELDFQKKVIELLERAEEKTGVKWVIISARRTMAEQQTIWNQGRTTPGEIATHARPGWSAHNFGLAVDVVPSKLGYNAPRSMFKIFADIAVGMGLTSGYYFKSIFDLAHVEDPIWKARRADWLEGKIEVR